MEKRDYLMKKRSFIDAIICDDARNLGQYLKPNSVALTITSPPYRNAIDYSQHVSNLKNEQNLWMRGTGTQSTENYLDIMKEIFDQVYKVTVEGGICCIVIGDEVVNGKIIPLPSLILSKIAETENEDKGKWRLRDVIVWNKTTSGRNGSGNRFGVFVQRPYPTNFRANIMHECILVLQKGKARIDLDFKKLKQIPLNRIMKREFANSIWNIAPVPPRSIKHPAVFPEQIPWRLIQLYSAEGDLVLDPMNGSGQTTKVARKLKRHYIGFDIRKDYVKIARERIDDKLQLGNLLIPVYHTEEWADGEQPGFFETTVVDLSKNIPAGYKYVFKTESDRKTNGKNGIYAFFLHEKNCTYLCFIISPNGKFSRINLGSIKDPNSMIRNVLDNLPETPFIKAQLNPVLNSRIVENRQPLKAVIDILVNNNLVKVTEKKGSSQEYVMTEKGKELVAKLKNKLTTQYLQKT